MASRMRFGALSTFRPGTACREDDLDVYRRATERRSLNLFPCFGFDVLDVACGAAVRLCRARPSCNPKAVPRPAIGENSHAIQGSHRVACPSTHVDTRGPKGKERDRGRGQRRRASQQRRPGAASYRWSFKLATGLSMRRESGKSSVVIRRQAARPRAFASSESASPLSPIYGRGARMSGSP